MKNTFGSSLTITLFGESHGEMIGVTLDGVAPGLRVNDESIRRALAKRRPSGTFSTSRVEDDPYKIISGVKNGQTTGAPLTLIIPNAKMRSQDYESLSNIPRPSHADYAANVKYHGFEDRRGGGHFSGRLTAPIVAVCAILEDALRENLGIDVGTHILSVMDIEGERMTGTKEEIERVRDSAFPVLSPELGEKMREKMAEVASEGDSVGGVLECVALGVPAGVGEPWFDSMESTLAHLLFSIGGVKGIEFGDGFGITEKRGSQANDPFAVVDGEVVTLQNASGGIQGGITNGMPIILRVAVKPTPSIYKEQMSVDLSSMQNTPFTISGRHDGAIVHRVASVVNALVVFGLSDMLVSRFGTDVLAEGIK